MLSNLNVLHYQHCLSHGIKFQSNLCQNEIPFAVKGTIIFSQLYCNIQTIIKRVHVCTPVSIYVTCGAAIKYITEW